MSDILKIIADNATILANSRIDDMYGLRVVSWVGVPKGEIWFVDKDKFYKYDNKGENTSPKEPNRE